MRDVGVYNAENSDWLWEFDGTPDEHRRFMAALASLEADDEDPTE